MKRTVKFMLILSFIFTSYLNTSEIMYSESVKNLYLNLDDSKSSGRLLPMTKVEVLETSGDKIKIKIAGFSKEGLNNALYFEAGKRILNAAFDKKAKINFKIIESKKVENDTYNLIEVIAWTDVGNFNKELNEVYASAKEMYNLNCSTCHKLHDTDEFNSNQWPSIVKAMGMRAGLSNEERYFITQYIQRHARDMKSE